MNRRGGCRLVAAIGLWGALAAPAVFGQDGGEDAYPQLLKAEFGTASEAMTAIEKQIHDAGREQYPAFETKLIAVVESAEATFLGKQFACRMLQIVGSSRCVPAVGKLLTDEKLSHMARYVFRGMRDPAVDEALRKGLERTQGALRIGMIETLGERGDREVVGALAALLTGGDEATAQAALKALGKIGGPQAADALDRAKVPDPLKAAWADARLTCAEGLAAAGDAARAEQIARSLFEGDSPAPVRAAALGALARVQKEQAVPLVVKMFRSDDPMLRRAAGSAVLAIPGSDATKAFARELPGLPPDGKAALLEALAGRGEPEGLTDLVNKLAGDEDATVRLAALKALASLGNASSVPVAAAAAKESGTAGKAAAQTLARLQGDGVVEALLKQAEAGDPAVRAATIVALADRRQAEALPAVRKAAGDADAKVRQSALQALAVLGSAEDLPKLVESLLARDDPAERDLTERALAAIAGRIGDKAARCEPILQGLAKADDKAKVHFLAVLSTLGGEKAYPAVRAFLAGGAGEVKKAAVRALAAWPDATPMADLLDTAKGDENQANKILALRGYIRAVGLASRPVDEKLQSYRQAMELSARPEEKKLVLAGLADTAHPEALKMAEACVAEPALKNEALVAAEKIAESIAGKCPEEARAALQRVIDATGDGNLRNRAKTALGKIKTPKPAQQ